MADTRKTRRLDSAPTRACISVPCIAGSRHGLIHPLYLPTCALVCVPERAGRPGIPRPIRDPMRLCDDPKAATTGTSGFRIRTGLRDEKNWGSPILALVPEAGREVQSMSSTPGNVRDVAIARRNYEAFVLFSISENITTRENPPALSDKEATQQPTPQQSYSGPSSKSLELAHKPAPIPEPPPTHATPFIPDPR